MGHNRKLTWGGTPLSLHIHKNTIIKAKNDANGQLVTGDPQLHLSNVHAIVRQNKKKI